MILHPNAAPNPPLPAQPRRQRHAPAAIHRPANGRAAPATHRRSNKPHRWPPRHSSYFPAQPHHIGRAGGIFGKTAQPPVTTRSPQQNRHRIAAGDFTGKFCPRHKGQVGLVLIAAMRHQQIGKAQCRGADFNQYIIAPISGMAVSVTWHPAKWGSKSVTCKARMVFLPFSSFNYPAASELTRF